MIYKVIIDGETLDIDDNVFFDKQPKTFKQMYETAIGKTPIHNAEFDNCFVEVYDNGRVIITLKPDEDGTI